MEVMRPLMEIMSTLLLAEREEGVEAAGTTEGAEVATALTTLTLPGPLPLVKVVGRRRKIFEQNPNPRVWGKKGPCR